MNIIQTSFSTGEIAPSIYGRTDIAQYANACEIVENFIPRSYGTAISMPGTRYVATVSDSTLRSRLMKFVFNKTDINVIEAGDLYMRFFANRGVVVTASATEDFSGLAANLVAQWKFNDNTNSTVVIENGGSYGGTSSTNTSTLAATGKVSGAFNFAGQYAVSVADNAAFTFDDSGGNGKFSVCAWVYYTSTGAQQTIIAKWASSNHEWRLYVTSTGHLKFELEDQSVTKEADIESSSALTAGWHFVVGTYDGRGGANAALGLNLYVDSVILTGVTRTTDSGYIAMENLTSSLTIGRRSGTPQEFWKDKIDTPAVFNTNLSATQIASIYSSGSTTYQLTTIFTEDELADIKYVQVNDVIWITHPNHAPQKLVRTSANEWTIADFDFKGGPFLDENTDTSIEIDPTSTTGTINIVVSPTTANLFTLSTSTLGHHNSYWRIAGLSDTNATTGLKEYGYVKITHVINSYTATATVIKALKSAASTSVWAEGAWSAVRGYPACVTFHGSRLYFARTDHEPQKVWGSKVFIYDNFALDTQADDDGLNLALASNESNEIQWLVSGANLYAGTFGGVFVIRADGELAITPDNVNAREEVGYGTSSIQAKKVGSFIYFLQRFAKKLRELFYSWENDTFKAVDATILSAHITGNGVVDMDIMTAPETIIHCVLTSGTLACMTREIDQQVMGWSRISTDGTFTSVAIVPSQADAYDEAWVIVERWVNSTRKKYVEYFENLEPPARQDLCLYLHSALTYNAYSSTSTSGVTVSLSASSGSVTLTSSTAYFAGGMINKRLRAIDENGNTIGEGSITATASTTSITLSITTTFNALSYTTGRWGVSVATISGLDHLEAKTLGILADGLTESLTRTVASGAVTLGSNYFVISAGLSYNQLFRTLKKEFQVQTGTIQTQWQRFDKIAFKVNRSTQNFKYGPDSSNLDDIQLAVTPTVTSLYTGILPPQGGTIAMRGGYQRGAQVYIKNTQPLPIEILNIVGNLESYEG